MLHLAVGPGIIDLGQPVFGAMGLVRKEQASEALLQAIVKVHAGEAWLDRALVADVLGEMTRTGAVQPADLELSRSPPSPYVSERSSLWLGRDLRTGWLPHAYVLPKLPYATI